jgi:hypothetical protein
MLPRYEFTAVLVIRHPNIDPAQLTKEFGRAPEYSWRAGDARAAGRADDADGTYRESYWVTKIEAPSFPRLEQSGISFATPVTLTSLESILWLGAMILKRRHDLWRRLQMEGATAEILLALVNRERFNLKLPTDLLAMMANLGLSVSVDVQASAQAAA